MKALALFSGGLDSTLAIKLILEQGIEVVALNFISAFCRCDKSRRCSSSIKMMADQLGIKFKAIYLGQDYLDMIKNPKYGYGRNMNPCIDCRIFKFKRAKKVMDETGASFVITGEVLGQRPMSQHRRALKMIEKEAGLEGLILRPLSAKLLAATCAEEKGWVKRDALLDISGRGRRPQMQLASAFGIKDYPCPAGGCLLTDPEFSKRVKIAMEHNELTVSEAEFLKLGRYFRITPSFRLTVGRDEKENNKLLGLAAKSDIIFEPTELPGPTAIGRGIFSDNVKTICSQIIARYTAKEKTVEVKIKTLSNNQEETITAKSIPEKALKVLRI